MKGVKKQNLPEKVNGVDKIGLEYGHFREIYLLLIKTDVVDFSSTLEMVGSLELFNDVK